MSEITRNIKEVLDGNKSEWRDTLAYLPVDELRKVLLKIDGVEVEIDSFETNGWQWDWWQIFTYKNTSYTIAGSGFYAGLHLFITEE